MDAQTHRRQTVDLGTADRRPSRLVSCRGSDVDSAAAAASSPLAAATASFSAVAAPSSWTAVIRRVQAEEATREAAMAELRGYVSNSVDALSRDIEVLQSSMDELWRCKGAACPPVPSSSTASTAVPGSPDVVDTATASSTAPALGKPDGTSAPRSPSRTREPSGDVSTNEASPGISSRRCSAPSVYFRGENDGCSISRLKGDVEKLDNLMVVLLQAQLGALHSELGLDLPRPRLPELQEALQRLDERRRGDAADLASRVGSVEDTLCSIAKDVVEWELSIQELAPAQEKGQQVTSRSFFLAGVSGFKLHYFPHGHRQAKDGCCSLFLSGPDADALGSARFTLFVGDSEQNSEDAALETVTVGKDLDDVQAKGFHNFCFVSVSATLIVGVRDASRCRDGLLDARYRDGGGLTHRFWVPSY